ncbi:hypothetical protein JV46_18190 [Solemya velum gill symbiont]|uniref:Uncharacterized protein n=1 Tax=Solemya velum gill symbiont TaxID=2340 RepID=A0A0B0HCK8_SOVGS|nr:hypothetical protein JV46_18190 [Solemya velum gill symbiont]
MKKTKVIGKVRFWPKAVVEMLVSFVCLDNPKNITGVHERAH